MKIETMKGLEGQMPDKAHLIVYTDNSGLATALPPGCRMGVVVRIDERDPLHDLLLLEVHRERLVFKCRCHPKCTKVYTFRRQDKGGHPQGMHIRD
jgi:hypothetical protein